MRSTASHFFCELGHSRVSVPKSKGHAKLYAAIYAEEDQLESCSRDPIHFLDGMSLYGNYFGLSRVDPSGLCVPKCEVVEEEALKITQDCVFLAGYARPDGYGFEFESQFTFSDDAPAKCSCCQFEQYVLWTANDIWVDIGRGYQKIATNNDIYDPDWLKEPYGNPKKPVSKVCDTYSDGGCKYKMCDGPSIDLMPNLQRQPPGALAGLRRVKIRVKRQFIQVIRDVCDPQQPSYASGPHFLNKECVQEWQVQNGRLVPINPRKK